MISDERDAIDMTCHEAPRACLTHIAKVLRFVSPENAPASQIADRVEQLATSVRTIGERWRHFEKHRSTCSIGEEELGEAIAEALAVMREGR